MYPNIVVPTGEQSISVHKHWILFPSLLLPVSCLTLMKLVKICSVFLTIAMSLLEEMERGSNFGIDGHVCIF